MLTRRSLLVAAPALLAARPARARRIMLFGRGGSGPLAVTNVAYGAVYKYNSGYPTKYIDSDVWASTTGSDGKIYAAHDDSSNWQTAFGGSSPNSGNFQISVLSNYTTSMTGTIANPMTPNFGVYGAKGSDNATYKAMGMISVNGTLYVGAARQVYGDTALAGAPGRQTSANMQIIKSINLGQAWTPLPPSQAQPYASPMFSGLVNNTCFFVQYENQDYQPHTVDIDGSNTYVYAVSNDGFWNNGSYLYLGRCLITDMPALDATKWSYWQTGNIWGAWGSATPIISNSLKVSSNGVQYLPYFKQYVHIQWWYPSIVAGALTDPSTTQWDFYTSPAPWGPWSLLAGASKTWNTSPGLGLYNPNIIPKSVSADGGRTVMITCAGDYNNQDPQTGDYTLTLVPVTLS